MDADALIDQLHQHGRALADNAARAGESAAVPTCPDWDVRALLAHTGMVHRWAGETVREGRARRGDPAELFAPPEHDIVGWFREGHAELVDALRAAPADLEAMTFLADPGPPRHFWARRQAHETAIHGADAAAAVGEIPRLDPEFALDGIAELLEGFFGRPRGALCADPPVAMRVTPSDSDVSWRVEIGPDTRTISRDGAGPVDTTLRGSAVDLYLYLWNRRPAGAVELDGDARAADVWRERARVTWS